MQRTLALLSIHGLDVKRMQVDLIEDPAGDEGDVSSRGVTILRTVVKHVAPDGGAGAADGAAGVDWDRLRGEVKRVKWVGRKALALASAHPSLGLARAEAAAALADIRSRAPLVAPRPPHGHVTSAPPHTHIHTRVGTPSPSSASRCSTIRSYRANTCTICSARPTATRTATPARATPRCRERESTWSRYM